ncbi:MAG: tyrosine-type recombinase/integrase [Verrucomicrobia bacterium]|nr:tyrosine-type recombinase/integrase [Verrucomicrobiota bacterium]
MPTLDLAPLLQRFFLEHLALHRHLSPCTQSAYRDTFRLLLRFLQRTRRVRPQCLPLQALEPDTVLAFLEHLERERHNGIRTRNARLAALHSFVRYLSQWLGPDLPAQTRRVLALPRKRCVTPMLGSLTREQIQALLAATDATWTGRRNHLLFLLLYNTGARISEVLSLRVADALDPGAHAVTLRGKGRKQRTLPLWPQTRRLLRRWIQQNHLASTAPLLPNRFGQPLSRSGVAWHLRQLVARALPRCPSLKGHCISAHTFRHSNAMHLLQAGVLPEVIALWLGHESPNTTHLYVEADLAMKQKLLQRVTAPKGARVPFHPSDKLLRFLDQL